MKMSNSPGSAPLPPPTLGLNIDRCVTLQKPFIEYSRPLTASASRHTLWQQVTVFCTMLSSIDVHGNAPPWNWRNCLLDVFKCSLKIINLPFERLFVTFWKLICSHAHLLLHADWMMLKNSSNQGGANRVTLAPWHTKSRLQTLVASKTLFLRHYLEVSTWILNGSSIECLEKKYQPFSLAGVRFGSLVNQISGLKSAWRRSGLCLTLLLCNCCYKWILRNNPRNQTNIFKLNVTLTTSRSQSCIIKCFLQG